MRNKKKKQIVIIKKLLFLFDIGELINEKQKVWIKSKLREDTVFV